MILDDKGRWLPEMMMLLHTTHSNPTEERKEKRHQIQGKQWLLVDELSGVLCNLHFTLFSILYCLNSFQLFLWHKRCYDLYLFLIIIPFPSLVSFLWYLSKLFFGFFLFKSRVLFRICTNVFCSMDLSDPQILGTVASPAWLWDAWVTK